MPFSKNDGFEVERYFGIDRPLTPARTIIMSKNDNILQTQTWKQPSKTAPEVPDRPEQTILVASGAQAAAASQGGWVDLGSKSLAR